MQELQTAKDVVRAYHDALDRATIDQLEAVIADHTAQDYHWRGLHPFHELNGAQAVAETFHKPLRTAFRALQRRPDVFLAGFNQTKPHEKGEKDALWVCQMGQFMGLFDAPFLDIPPTGRIGLLRFAEFNRVENGKITETAMFFDLIGLMRQAGQYPLPPQTGASLAYCGPLTHDGLLFEPQDTKAGETTMALVHSMVEDLRESNEVANATGDNHFPREVLARSWHENMIWSGPEGIGATYTIDRYQQQHQYPFRKNLTGKQFNGHVARFAEGNYACFFGWPNLTNTPTGGFMGLPGGEAPADMRVVDVYRRDGDKLAENWVFIDLPHWLNMQGLDVLKRMRQQLGIESL